MSTPILRPTAALTVAGEDREVSDGEARLDDGRVPYATASVEIPLVDLETIEEIDPRNDLRGTLVAGDERSGSSRTFDLALRSRSVNHKTRKIMMSFASDEALLMEWAPLVDDLAPLALASSFRDVCDYVLDKIGASLSAGTDDADLTPYWTVTNLVPNPNVRSIVGNWIAGGANGTLVRQSGLTGSPVADVTTCTLTTWSGNSGAGQGGAFANSTTVTPYIVVAPFKTYTISVWLWASASKTVDLKTQVFGADGTVLSGGTIVTTVTLAAATWTRVSGTITTPANASRLGPFVYASTGVQWTSGQSFRTLGWMVYEGTLDVPTFDGATPADANYEYVISGDANASATTREPVNDTIGPEALIWKAGVTAWEFLEPLATVAGLRLFCDELRVWRVVDPSTYAADGLVSVAGWNASEGVDLIDRDDPNVVCTGVVVTYEWSDEFDVQRTAMDVAGSPGRVLKWVFKRPYPGPGAAAAILSRRVSSGRTQSVTALANFEATPGMEASISLPGTIDQIGRIQSVTWDLRRALMSVETKGLADAAPDTWLGTDPALDWDAVDDDLDWEDA